MNEPQTLTARIIGWLKKPKFWLGFVIAAATIGSAFFLLFPCSGELSTLFSETSNVETASLVSCYDGLSAWLITLAGGFLAVAVLLETGRRANAAEKAVGQTEKALDQTKESIVQKTFSDAINHLGHESESVILGGIHSLLDLAKKNSDYRPRVFNILCAHIKTTTTTEEYRKKYPIQPSKIIPKRSRFDHDLRKKTQKKPSTTIQILLSSLFIDKEYDIFTVDTAKTSRTADEEYGIFKVGPDEKIYRADFSGARLAGSELSKARLQDINLAGAQLQGANLKDAQLQGTNLIGAHLQEADLTGAQLQGAFLMKAQLQGADLNGAQLQGAYLNDAQLQSADLTAANLQSAHLEGAQLQEAFLYNAGLQGVYGEGAQLQRANLTGADLQGARLGGVQLQGADLTGADLQGARLGGVQLQGADLRGAQLQNANLMGSWLQGANLEGAQLQSADLTGAQLQGANLKEAKFQSAKLQHAKMQGAYMYQTELSDDTNMGSSDLRGVSSQEDESHMKFQTKIKSRKDKKADHAGVVFNGVVSKEPNPDLVAFLERSKAKTGPYTEEEADQWIKEYKKALD